MSELKKSVITEAVNIIANSDIDLSTMFNQDGLLKQLTKELVEKALEGELKNHLGYEKYKHNDTSDNYRNGHSTKNLITDQGTLDIKVPRDRQGSFDPQIVSKHQSRIKGLDEKIVSLYAKGISVNDIHIQLKELYGAEISPSLISDITSEVIGLV
ncbi:transposase, partial [Francisella sp. 19X1-34]|uniref:transposase n=1 Tax=Francisella sp. 19X1-34 TaxID=3087177 RepID=UPI002E2EDCA9